MKITHRVPVCYRQPTISERYEAAVQRATARGEREYRQMQERLQRAIERKEAHLRRIARAKERNEKRKEMRRLDRQLAVIDALVEQRKEELRAWSSMMRTSPAASHHRGRDGTPPPAWEPGELI